MSNQKKFHLFSLGKKKSDAKPKSTGQSLDNDEDSDEGYQDPSSVCSTNPPESTIRAAIPKYPPPRCNNETITTRKDEWHDSTDKSTSSRKPYDPKRNENYKQLAQYEVPFDNKVNHLISEPTYDQPETLETAPKNTNNADTYSDPWDTKPNVAIANTNKKEPLSEYSDPWDATNKVASVGKNSEDFDTYSEPYDQGKDTMYDSTKKKPPISDDEDDYDMPYEEQKKIGIIPKVQVNNNTKPNAAAASGNYDDPWEYKNVLAAQAKLKAQPAKVASPIQPLSPMKSVQPRVEPPKAKETAITASDYDSPWDWKIKNVEEDFANKFSLAAEISTPRTVQEPAKEVKKEALGEINPVAKPSRSTTKPVTSTTKPNEGHFYQVDPTIPLQNQGWFHGSIPRNQAEDLLRLMPDCSYLIRNSESSKENYSLSLKNKAEVMHLKIHRSPTKKFILGANSKPYDTIPEMVHNYSMNKLNIRSAEHMKLLYPVLQEPEYFTVEMGT